MIKQEVISKLKSINELKLLNEIANVSTWKHNSVTRMMTAGSLSIAEITLKCCLKSLLDKGLIQKTVRGLYNINKDIIQ